MKKELKFICAQPDDNYYIWQVALWVESLKKLNMSDKAIVLVFTPSFREKNKNWEELHTIFPEVKFVYYKDQHNISRLLGTYIPVLRPYILSRYFREYATEVKDQAFFYCDSDILFTEHFNVNDYIQDDICYLSNTNSYINAAYFDSKIKDVKLDKLEEYKTLDVLSSSCKISGITRDICVKNNSHSGGAQYLLKNIDANFWEKVMQDCILIRTHLQQINRKYFVSETVGFQSWCADMWAVLWNLWRTEHETKVIKEMDFAWATDEVTKLDSHGILHNAGVTGDKMNDIPFFYKGKYVTGTNPTKVDMLHLQSIITNDESRKKCTWFYTKELLNLHNKYSLNY